MSTATDSRSSDIGTGSELVIERFTYAERVVHWVVGLSFLYLLATGMALSHPRLFWVTALSGGGTATRVLHPWIGLVFSVALGAMFLARSLTSWTAAPDAELVFATTTISAIRRTASPG